MPTTIRTTPIRSVSCGPESGPAVCSLAAVYGAYGACRRRKRGTRNAQRYELKLLDQLVNTAQALSGRVWCPSRALAFVVRRPKAREILAADFADRVVHHLLVPRLDRQFEPVFIHDCFSNRCGKGTHGAINRLLTFLRRAEGEAKKTQQRLNFLQLDIANFFYRIHRCRPFELVRQRFERDLRRPPYDPRHVGQSELDDVLWLTRQLLAGNAAHGAVSRGTPAEFALVPPHKRLINVPAESGLPIGNLTSQFFANVYLNALDQFVKHTLKSRYYVRYVDDIVLLDPDPAVLARWQQQIAVFLEQQLGLRLRDANVLQPVACVLLQVGNRVELYGADARHVAQWTQHGGLAVERPGWTADEAGLSWPLARLDALLQRLTRHGLAWVYVDEQGWLKGRLKQRALRRLYVLAPTACKPAI